MNDAPIVLAADINSFSNHEEAALALLPFQERVSISRNRRAEDRQRRLGARLLLSCALQMVLGWEIHRGLAAMRREACGRPWIKGCSRPVSISHAGRWAICAVGAAAQQCIGVDVERIQPLLVDDFHIVFSHSEMQAINAHCNPHSELIRRWTIKEAVLKAQGTGLLNDPKTVDSSSDLMGWDWEHLCLDPFYHLTVAGRSPTGKAKLTVLTSFEAAELGAELYTRV